MLIKISDPVFQTFLFSVIFLPLLTLSIRKRQDQLFFSQEVTSQLKGLAILAIIFSHIGYFLSSDPQFLYPYSILAGVGVNLFLLLSGFGLTVSQLKYPLTPLQFYKKRLFRLFLPLWVVITAFFLADFLILHRSYPATEIIHGFLGFYPGADLFQNLDSPLWYFSVIFFLYLIFPLVFIRKLPWVSPVLVLLLSFVILHLPLPIDPDVLKLYKLHFLAFPLGMLFGLGIQKIKVKFPGALKLVFLALAVLVLLYTAVNSGVNQDPKIEQGISLITTLSLIVIFSLSRFDFKLLSLFGVYSYETYLLHWPILSRYNLYLGLPPFLIVTLNLALILLLGLVLQKIVNKVTTPSRK